MGTSHYGFKIPPISQGDGIFQEEKTMSTLFLYWYDIH